MRARGCHAEGGGEGEEGGRVERGGEGVGDEREGGVVDMAGVG